MRALLFALCVVASTSAAAAELREWRFRVLLDGREIGRHSFTLRTDGAERELRSDARFDVRVLFIDVYRYAHRATERWQDGCLRALVAQTDANGAREDVTARIQGSRLVVERADGRDEHDGCVMSFAYWNPAILKASRLLNSQTGELLPVTVASRGEETIPVRGRALAAERHHLSAPELAIDLWYAAGEWVALETSVGGGRRLRYELI
jgi:hypothetical protein